MEKKHSSKEKQLETLKTSIHRVINARVDLEKELVDMVHTSLKEATDDDNNISVLGLISSALNREARILNNLQSRIEKDKEPGQQ